MRYAPASMPLLLLLDGHSSHYCPDTLKLAAENDIIIFALPPNTPHLTQPLDKGVLGPFKTHWKRVCHDFQISHPGRVINYYSFCSLFSKAWMESMTSVNVMSGFETTGIYPVNWDAVLSVLPCQSTPSEGIIVPGTVFTPYKRVPEDGLYTSADFPSLPKVDLVKRPNSIAGITSLKIPKLKPRRIKPPSDMVLISSDFRINNAGPGASSKTTVKSK